MKESVKLVQPSKRNNARYRLDFLNSETINGVCRFHESFPVYEQTPLVSLNNLAAELGIGGIYVKDESYRFGLNAFKVLGASYAIGKYLANKLGMDINELPYEKLVSDEVRNKLGKMTFITATDGNHGRGVAWTANQLKQHSVVYMPKGSSQERLENIKKEGADASITDMNYDEAVRLANSKAELNGWVIIQDTAWAGYTDIPTWIMQGYATMGYEAYKQLPDKPTHIFLQAGVGSMAGAITGLFASIYGDDCPHITVVEPNKADCVFRTAKADDGKLHFVTGHMDTIMAGLACGEPSSIGWSVLRDYAHSFISCPDYIAAKGMRILGNPPNNDRKVISGESGAVTAGLVAELMTNPKHSDIKEAIGLNENSKVLCFNTEGDTDRAHYKAVVWDGKNSSYNK